MRPLEAEGVRQGTATVLGRTVARSSGGHRRKEKEKEEDGLSGGVLSPLAVLGKNGRVEEMGRGSRWRKASNAIVEHERRKGVYSIVSLLTAKVSMSRSEKANRGLHCNYFKII